MKARLALPSDTEISDSIVRLTVAGVETVFARSAFSQSTLEEFAPTALSSLTSDIRRPELGHVADGSAVRTSSLGKEALGLLARIVIVVFVAVPWIVGLLWLGWWLS